MSIEFTQDVAHDEIREQIRTFDLTPYDMRLFIREKKLVEKIGAIYIPTDTKELTVTEGYVISVGDGVTFTKPGDLVFYAKYSGAGCSWKGQNLRVMNEDDLLGKGDNIL